MRQRQRNFSERGQVIILALLVMSVTFVVGAITIDLTLWLSERRGSQTDADLAALAGAFELLDPGSSATDAINAATGNLDNNDEQLNASLANPIVVDDSCFERGIDDAVSVNVQHDSRALFFDIFGVTDAPAIGAHAKACVGAAQGGPGDLVPFQIADDPGPCFDSNEEPIFTSMCPLELGAQGGPSTRGMLDLEAPDGYCSDSGGSGDIEDLIEWGAPGPCLINENPSASCGTGPWIDCAAVQTGNPKKVLDGVNARVSREGACDTDGDGTEEFLETVVLFRDTGDPLSSIYEARDCDPLTAGRQISPRLVTIIIFEEEPGPGNGTFPIIAFAGFYLAGCAHEDDVVVDESDLDEDCNAPGGGPMHIAPPREVYVSGPGVAKLGHCGGGAGHGSNPPCPTPTPTPTPTPAPTPTPTPTPPPTPTPTGGSTPTPTPSPTPGPGPSSCGSPGHCVVYGRFVFLIESGGAIGTPTDQTTIFGIALVE